MCLSFGNKEPWYPVIRGGEGLLWTGRPQDEPGHKIFNRMKMHFWIQTLCSSVPRDFQCSPTQILMFLDCIKIMNSLLAQVKLQWSRLWCCFAVFSLEIEWATVYVAANLGCYSGTPPPDVVMFVPGFSRRAGQENSSSTKITQTGCLGYALTIYTQSQRRLQGQSSEHECNHIGKQKTEPFHVFGRLHA